MIYIIATVFMLTCAQNSSSTEASNPTFIKDDGKELSALGQMLLKHQALGLKIFCDSSYTSQSKSLKQKLLNRSSQSPVLSRIFSSPTQLEGFIRKVADAERTQLAPAVEDDLDGFPELPNVLNYTAKLQTNMSVFMKNYASKEQLAYYAKIGFSMKALLTLLKTDYTEQIRYFYLDMGSLDLGDGDNIATRVY